MVAAAVLMLKSTVTKALPGLPSARGAVFSDDPSLPFLLPFFCALSCSLKLDLGSVDPRPPLFFVGAGLRKSPNALPPIFRLNLCRSPEDLLLSVLAASAISSFSLFLLCSEEGRIQVAVLCPISFFFPLYSAHWASRGPARPPSSPSFRRQEKRDTVLLLYGGLQRHSSNLPFSPPFFITLFLSSFSLIFPFTLMRGT